MINTREWTEKRNQIIFDLIAQGIKVDDICTKLRETEIDGRNCEISVGHIRNILTRAKRLILNRRQNFVDDDNLMPCGRYASEFPGGGCGHGDHCANGWKCPIATTCRKMDRIRRF